ncbi:site-specific DNA-methyltransferase [Sphingomonas glacialis]|uniref:site-specific DNA-methyltransferase (adenine-specific) n=1 Tax=Sphingomonas glacialis TaxID=658225 RepID=A0A502G6W5_9SPHN|nr:DNA methyltransferase [Sphingomonas glacialis]TPG56603.1 site-specific DNA-methyltransferase [Sphingomonas glacialis]
MAKLDELIALVEDPSLRARLATTATTLASRVTLGLNFERHIPEFVSLPGLPIRPGMMVSARGSSHSRPLRVVKLEPNRVVCTAEANGATELLYFEPDAIVALKRSNEPIYPALIPVASDRRDDAIAEHVLIEGENLAVLELLEWTHSSRFQCIYIDPPYNTGARDWRYNNDYVDRNDAFKSSKWLSMMERRLVIARRLLASDGVLVVAIDDYEYAHLVTLLGSERLFRGWTIETVVIQHNPRGGGGNHISNTHEYAVFVVPPGRSLAPIAKGSDELRDYRRRGRGDNNRRSGRPKSFFAIHVDPETREVVGVGPEIGKDDTYPTDPTAEGHQRIYPLGRDGLERVWRNTRIAVRDGIVEKTLTLRCTANDTIVQVISGERKTVPIRSIWSGARYNAGEQGTNLVEALTGVEFPYPKSIYTVLDCLKATVGDRPEALVLDFFGGSGTTAHALQLLNEFDDGHRQAFIVTNNELGEPKERELSLEGVQPYEDAWERHGICRAVTYPRLANAISGARDDAPVEWDLELGGTRSVETEMPIRVLPFVGPAQAAAPAARAALAPFLGLPAKLVRDAWPYYVPPADGDRHKTALLFDLEAIDDFADAAAEAGEIEQVFVVSSGTDPRDRAMTVRLREALGPRVVDRPVTRKASEGLRANLNYLRMLYLDPGEVEIGQRLADLIPTLWLMAGARGPVPRYDDMQGYLLSCECGFALLADESAFRTFRAELEQAKDVSWAFLVCDSDDGFQQLCAALPPHIPPRRRIRLYRDYLTNFRINLGDR